MAFWLVMATPGVVVLVVPSVVLASMAFDPGTLPGSLFAVQERRFGVDGFGAVPRIGCRPGLLWCVWCGSWLQRVTLVDCLTASISRLACMAAATMAAEAISQSSRGRRRRRRTPQARSRDQRERLEGFARGDLGWFLVDTNPSLSTCSFSYFTGGTPSLGSHG